MRVSGGPINGGANVGSVVVAEVNGCENGHHEMDDAIKRVISSMVFANGEASGVPLGFINGSLNFVALEPVPFMLRVAGNGCVIKRI